MTKLRVQPPFLEIPPNDPFRNDCLDRKKSIEILTHFVANFSGPCVIAIDADWGQGKSTYLSMWQHYLEQQDFPVIHFNAWETDFSNDPLIVLSSEISTSLETFEFEKQDYLKKLEKCLLNLSKNIDLESVLSNLVQNATGGVINIRDSLKSDYFDRLHAYKNVKVSFQEFQELLREIAASLSHSKDDKPLVVMIDELDRCRPNYAVDLLEVCKHLFAVDNTVFVLTVNCSQIEHSIKSLYGSEFDAEGYLRRFFDLKFRLPSPDKDKFVEQKVNELKLFDNAQQTRDEGLSSTTRCKKILLSFFNYSEIDFRTVAQAFHHLGLIFASLPANSNSLAAIIGVLICVRTVQPDDYYAFIRGKLNDLELVERLSQNPIFKNYRQIDYIEWFEAILILAFAEISNPRFLYDDVFETPLLKYYEELDSEFNPQEVNKNEDIAHAVRVSSKVNNIFDTYKQHAWDYIGCKAAINRIELFSPEYANYYELENNSNA